MKPSQEDSGSGTVRRSPDLPSPPLMSFTCWMTVVAAALALAQGILVTVADHRSAAAVWLISATVIATLLLQGRCARRMRQGALEARQHTAVQTDLLEGLAHDVRNPLLAISGYADVLARQWDAVPAEEAIEFLHAIRSKVGDIEFLVDSVVDLDRMANGDGHDVGEPFDLAMSVEAAVADARIQATHALVVEVPASPLPAAIGDARSHLRVLGNLLSNAMKYSPKGTVVHVALGERDGMLEVSVADHGHGILAVDLPLLFHPFERGKFLGPGPPPSGTGLGLYLCRVMIEGHGGSIGVRSRPGAGTTVTYTLPKARASRTTRDRTSFATSA